ncbi:hypothetical protein FRC01_008305 [Tulasnella sp. 417]|nr:hypothetical protein FRC01_008305 [Tulasnella sp. 417]
MVDVFERIKTKTEVAGDMPLAGYLCQLWDHFLWTLASPTRTFGALEKPVPLLSVSEPHMQNALANKALGRSYKTGALACQGKLLVPSEKPQSSTKTDKVSKRAAEKGRSALRIMSSDEDEDEDSSGDKARNVLRRGEKEGFAAASKFAQGRQGTLDSNTNESLKRLRELRAAAERLPGRSTEASKAGMKVTIHGLQRLDEDAAIYQRNLVKTTVPVTRDDTIAGLRGHISSSKEVAEAMQYDEENLDGAEFAGTKVGGGFSATQGDILHSLNGFMRKNSHPEVEKLFGDYDSSEEEFFGSTTPADDDLYDWMPIY